MRTTVPGEIELRALDAQVAERVEGYERVTVHSTEELLLPPGMPVYLREAAHVMPGWSLPSTFHVPRYSSNAQAALELAERVANRKGLCLWIHSFCRGERGPRVWLVSFGRREELAQSEAQAETLAEAVVLAVLGLFPPA